MAKQNTTTAPKGTTAPATATTPQATPPSATPVNAALTVVYAAGKAYNVRPGTAQANDRSWAAIQAVLASKGGQATRADIQAAVAPYNHVPFVGYCIKRGYLVPAAPTTQPA